MVMEEGQMVQSERKSQNITYDPWNYVKFKENILYCIKKIYWIQGYGNIVSIG